MLTEVSLKNNVSTIKWYAVRTRSRAEKKVAERISPYGEVYLPIQTQWRQWSDRKKKVEVPLIPSFVFIKVTERELLNTVREDGVVGVLRFLGKPAVVREEEIEVLKLLTQQGEGVQQINPIDLSKGDLVEVMRGSFAGMQATYIHHQGKHKVIVTMEATGTYFQVEVPLNHIQKLTQSA